MRFYDRDPAHFETFQWEAPEPPERLEDLRVAIDRLPPQMRRVVEGVFWERVSQRELARREGVSKDEIAKRLREGLATLRKNKKVLVYEPLGPVPAEVDRTGEGVPLS